MVGQRGHRKRKTLDFFSVEYGDLSDEMTDGELLDVVESMDAVPIDVVQELFFRGRGDTLFFRYQFDPSFCQEIRAFLKTSGLDSYLRDLRNEKKNPFWARIAGRWPVR